MKKTSMINSFQVLCFFPMQYLYWKKHLNAALWVSLKRSLNLDTRIYTVQPCNWLHMISHEFSNWIKLLTQQFISPVVAASRRCPFQRVKQLQGWWNARTWQCRQPRCCSAGFEEIACIIPGIKDKLLFVSEELINMTIFDDRTQISEERR